MTALPPGPTTQVRAVLDALPTGRYICVREGGGLEDIYASLAVSVAALSEAVLCLDAMLDAERGVSTRPGWGPATHDGVLSQYLYSSAVGGHTLSAEVVRARGAGHMGALAGQWYWRVRHRVDGFLCVKVDGKEATALEAMEAAEKALRDG